MPLITVRFVLVLILGGMMAACGSGFNFSDSGSHSSSGDGKDAVVKDSHVRFTVLSPTLIRLEYADDDLFEDGLTQTVVNRNFPSVAYSTGVENGERIIKTSALTLHYQQNSGPFTNQNLSISVRVADGTNEAKPDWANDNDPENVGGWRRSLDNDQDPQPLHNGLLSKRGWHLLNDSQTVLMTAAAPGFAARRGGTYQDGYFFGYSHDYAQGLDDLRHLTGPAPLLPRKAFGVWFSRYWAYSESEIKDLVAQFRSHQIPLDTLSVDTDWKAVTSPVGCVIFSLIAGARANDPCSWNNWSWNTSLFPNPKGFLDWAHSQGLAIGLNVHPSINSNDLFFAQTQTQTGGMVTDQSTPPCQLYQADPTGQCYVFDWTKQSHLDAYFALHKPMEEQGVDFWWLDWCCDGSSAIATGLTADTWINSHYAKANRARGSRWPAFSRIGASFQEGKAGISNGGAGAFAEHRYTMHFTGDTCGTWQMLAHEAEFTVAEGAIGLPYVTHDIGSFLGPPTQTGCNGTLGHTSHLPDDMYVRWVQFGTFQPLDRLHSHHGDRLPWDYAGAAEQASSEFLRLRERLVPHLYTLARRSYDTGLPITRALYFQWPDLDEAYRHPTQYTLGYDLLVVPVINAGNPAPVSVWIPPGKWIDYFTGEIFSGPNAVSLSVPFERYPVFVKAGSMLLTQSDQITSSTGPQDNLVLNIWPLPNTDSGYELYEDEGTGFGYQQNLQSRTNIQTRTDKSGCTQTIISAAQGSFPGALSTRSWEVRFIGINSPTQVLVNDRNAPNSTAGNESRWSFNTTNRSLTVWTGPKPTSTPVTIEQRTASCK